MYIYMAEVEDGDPLHVQVPAVKDRPLVLGALPRGKSVTCLISAFDCLIYMQLTVLYMQ